VLRGVLDKYVKNNLNGMSDDDSSDEVNIGEIVSGELYSEETIEELQVTNCSLREKIPLDNPKVLGSLIPLGLICLIVTCGNILVISAVKISSKLRGPTNTIIVSLAVADLLLGVLVLPLSAVYEVVDSWVFGRHLCFIWLSVDVWTCTASILHLVAISMDRYIAVTHPVTYPNIMTSTRTKLLICSVWIISFIICFPPLVGWNEEHQGSGFDRNYSLEEYESAEMSWNSSVQPSGFVDNGECSPQCILPSDPGYVLYSAIGSFFAPMLVMIFFNWRIYRVASKTTKAIRRGFTKVKSDGGNAGSMGIHRGRSMVKSKQSEIALSEREISKDHSDTKDSKYKQGLYAFPSKSSLETYRDRDSLLKSNASTINMSTINMSSINMSSINMSSVNMSSINMNGETQLCTQLMANGSYTNGTHSKDINGAIKSNYSCAAHCHRRYFTEQGTQTVKTFKSRKIRRRSSSNSFKREKPTRRFNLRLKKQSSSRLSSEPPSPTHSLLDEATSFTKSETSFTKRNIKSQVRRFRMETKAAKTIGIIVGCFVLCWLPFFTIYITRAACVDCVPDLLFSVFFWLGYCNSAINPVIYGLFSREFRAAFKKIICKFFCKATK